MRVDIFECDDKTKVEDTTAQDYQGSCEFVLARIVGSPNNEITEKIQNKKDKFDTTARGLITILAV